MYYWEYDEEAHRWAIEKDAEEKGMEIGLKKGMEEGMQKGMEEGMQKGMEKGMQKGMEKGMQKGMEEGMQKGMQKGIAIGSEQGEILQLIRLMTKKIQKNKSLSIIADELESESELLQPVWDAVNAEAPAYDEHLILRRLFPDPVNGSDAHSDSED